MGKAWVTDAQILEDEGSIKRTEHSILLRTPAVQSFLATTDLPSCALVAPKGFGKTFVLKIKRLSLQDVGYNCLPHGAIVDRPKSRPPTISKETVGILKDSGPWESVWQIAFCISALKISIPRHSDEFERMLLSIKSSVLKDIMISDTTETPFEIVHRVLQFSRKQIITSISESATFSNYYSRIKDSYAIFVDNIDEYVDDYLKTLNGTLIPLSLWHNSQIGALLAIRQLQGINAKIKIFISLRKEAFHYAQNHEPLFANLESFTRELRYSKIDLSNIVEMNIISYQNSHLGSPSSSDVIGGFVGTEGKWISNAGTGMNEPIIDYWLRHCIGRPRDAVSIGGAISEIEPDRRIGTSVRSAINGAASDLVAKLFNESRFHIPDFDSELIAKLIPNNVLSRENIESISREYNRVKLNSGECSEIENHPFCALYALGLLGIVREDSIEPGKFIQYFSNIGRFPLGNSHVVPNAEIYVVHPALSDYISTKDATFIGRLHRFNVIGHDREWREPTDYAFVVVGDIARYRTEIMNKVGPSQAFPKFWKGAFARSTQGLGKASASEGDKFVIADRDPVNLFRACVSLQRQLQSSEFRLDIRIGGHSGFWKLSASDGGDSEISEIVGFAARIEPCAEPGTIAISEQFFKGLDSLPDIAGQFSADPETTTVSKVHEELEQVRLFRANLHVEDS